MTRGQIDSLTTSGLIEGWAHDETRAFAPLGVAVLNAQAEEIAAGLADLFRDDLALARIGFGWCAFRLKLAVAPEGLRDRPLRLIDAATGAEISQGPAALRQDKPHEIGDLDALVACDPTVLASLEQLEGLAPVFDAYVGRHGVEAFVGAAYLYVLGRRADASGVESFTRLIRSKRFTPYGLLLSLAEGQEFRDRGRMPPPPNRPGFPFFAP